MSRTMTRFMTAVGVLVVMIALAIAVVPKAFADDYSKKLKAQEDRFTKKRRAQGRGCGPQGAADGGEEQAGGCAEGQGRR